MSGSELMVGLITAFALIQGASSILVNSFTAELAELSDTPSKHIYRIFVAIMVSYLWSVFGIVVLGWGVLATVKVKDFGISGDGEILPSVTLDGYSFLGGAYLFIGICVTWVAVIYASGLIAIGKKRQK